VTTRYEDMILNKISVETSCCKQVIVSLSGISFLENTDVENVISLTSTAAPMAYLTVALSAQYESTSNSSILSVAPFFPSTVTISPKSWKVGQGIALVSSSAGAYSIAASLSGPDAKDFEVVFSTADTLTLLTSTEGMKPPVLKTVQFSGDGRTLNARFDSPTDKAYRTNDFACSHVFEFTGSDDSKCEWVSPVAVVITLGGSSRVGVGSYVSVVDGVVRAQCSLSLSECLEWATVKSTRVPVLAPESPLSPVVAISGPTVVGPCDTPVLDSTSSSGSGGRPWNSFSVSVTSQNAESARKAEVFFDTSYRLNPPTPIPLGTLQPGFLYDFHVSICNFLGACSQAVHRLEVTLHSVPVVTIVGQQVRSVATGNPLLLKSQAYISHCNGTVSYSGLRYSWSVYKDDVLDSSIQSLTVDSSKFKVQPYSLQPNSLYAFTVAVSSTLTPLSSKATVTILVPQSDLVAMISGGSEQSVRQGESIILDAFDSYDMDNENRTSDGLSYTWECKQLKPMLSPFCLIGLDIVNDYVIISANSSSVLGSVNVITLTISDSTREARDSVYVTVSDAAAPVVTVSAKNKSPKLNPSNDIIIFGTVEVPVTTAVMWSVDDDAIDLSSFARTKIRKTLQRGIHSFNLVVAGSSLRGKRTPYTFSLLASGTKASIAVVVNTAPLPGVFEVSPGNGTALNTMFSFSASQWADDDVPLSYEFGFSTTEIGTNVIKGRSEAAFCSSYLPVGRATSGYTVVCSARVFDALSAYTKAESSIIVNEIAFSDESLRLKISEQLALGEWDIDIMKGTVAIASSMLNTRDCSSTPDCVELHREECSYTKNTCGECFAGFIGVEGDDNSLCINETEFLSGSNLSCMSDSDCGGWDYCGITNECIRKSKACNFNCSDNGVCVLRKVDSGKETDYCAYGDSACEAQCECFNGYMGSVCDISSEDMNLKQEMRTQLIRGLEYVVQLDDPSTDSIESWLWSLTALTESPEELNHEGTGTVLSIATSLITMVADYDLSYHSMLDIFGPVNTALLASADSSQKNATRRKLVELYDTVAVLDAVGAYVASGMVDGEDSFDTINTAVRLTSQVLTPEIDMLNSLSIPLTNTEVLSNTVPSTCTFGNISGLTHRVVAMSLKAKLYDEAVDFTSNTMRIKFVGKSTDDIPTMTFNIRNWDSERYDPLSESLTVNTTCEDGDNSRYYHSCLGGPDGNITVTHTCNGTTATIQTRCPRISSVPGCRVLSGFDFNCSVQSYTEHSTTCVCTKLDDEGRRLSAKTADVVENSGALEVVAVSTILVEDFVTTITDGGHINSVNDVEDTMIIILLYGVMWATGLLGVFTCSLKQLRNNAKTSTSAKNKIEKKKDLAKSTRSKEDINAYLVAYVNEIFPAVFQSNSTLSRLVAEIRKHHRYILIFTATGPNAESIRMLTCMHLLTIQSMLMFMLALCYDLQYPEDDGTCGAYETEKACLSEKSPFDVSKSLCSWSWIEDVHGDGFVCVYDEGTQTLTVQSVVIISIVIAMFTAPVNLLVDFLFIDVLSAPTVDSLKMKNEVSALSNMARRASMVGANVGRRLSTVGKRVAQVSGDTVKRVTQRNSFVRNTLRIETTRQVPDITAEAQALATVSAAEVMSDARRDHDQNLSLRKEQRSKSSVWKQRMLLEEKRKKSMKSSQRKKDGKSYAVPLPDEVTHHDLFLELCVDITEQRRLLKRSQQESFDSMWGIDPTGEFCRRQSNFLCGVSYFSAENVIKKELAFVREESNAKFKKLRLASDVHIGLEILHLFCLDLLGRNTPVARIFQIKAEEDFRHAMVVTKTAKRMAWLTVVVLNLFFVYFSMLRGLERGLAWQQTYLTACIIQFIIEIFFYETTECAFVHFLIPDLARNEVRSAAFTMHQAIQKICWTGSQMTPTILDAPRYFFVSTNVAQKFPHLLESIIVQSYHSYLPGEIGNKWKFMPASGLFGWRYSSRSRVVKFSLTNVLVRLLQHLGGTSPTAQRVLIHLMQPLAVSGLFVLWVVLWKHPLWSIVFGVLIVYKTVSFLKDYHERREGESIMPLASLPSQVTSGSDTLESMKNELSPKSSIGGTDEPHGALEESCRVPDEPVEHDYRSIETTGNDARTEDYGERTVSAAVLHHLNSANDNFDAEECFSDGDCASIISREDMSSHSFDSIEDSVEFDSKEWECDISVRQHSNILSREKGLLTSNLPTDNLEECKAALNNCSLSCSSGTGSVATANSIQLSDYSDVDSDGYDEFDTALCDSL